MSVCIKQAASAATCKPDGAPCDHNSTELGDNCCSGTCGGFGCRSGLGPSCSFEREPCESRNIPGFDALTFPSFRGNGIIPPYEPKCCIELGLQCRLPPGSCPDDAEPGSCTGVCVDTKKPSAPELECREEGEPCVDSLQCCKSSCVRDPDCEDNSACPYVCRLGLVTSLAGLPRGSCPKRALWLPCYTSFLTSGCVGGLRCIQVGRIGRCLARQGKVLRTCALPSCLCGQHTCQWAQQDTSTATCRGVQHRAATAHCGSGRPCLHCMLRCHASQALDLDTTKRKATSFRRQAAIACALLTTS